jgi:hypothetical protein
MKTAITLGLRPRMSLPAADRSVPEQVPSTCRHELASRAGASRYPAADRGVAATLPRLPRARQGPGPARDRKLADPARHRAARDGPPGSVARTHPPTGRLP